MNDPESKVSPPAQSTAALGAILLLAILIGGPAFVIYPSVWLVEQIGLAGGQPFSDWGWVVVVAAHGTTLLLLSLLGIALTTDRRYRSVFRMWAMAGLFALLVLPVRFAGSEQPAALLQIGCVAVYLGILTLLRRRAGMRITPATGSLWPALLAAALIVWPWVAWGALGSWLDTALNLAAALLFGLAAGLTLERYLLSWPAETVDGPPLSYGLSSLVAGVMLLTMGAAFGANGMQLILLFLMSGLGWLVVAVARWGRDEHPAGGWATAWLLVGLVVAAPMLFVDPDELVLILNLATRDVGYYALNATLIGLGTSLLLGVLAWFFLRRPANRKVPVMIGLGLVGLAGLLLIYFLVGQPGWHGERLYVILADQPDVSAATAIPDPIERRTFVYETLTHHAGATQAELRRSLDAAGIDYRPYYLVNALEVDAGPFVRRWLESRPEVDRVLDSPELRPLPEPPPIAKGNDDAPTEPAWNLVNIGAPRVWDEFGVRGQGVVIGQNDSGVDGAHPELNEQYRGSQPDGPAGDDYNWLDPWYATTSPTDRGGHGTHTLGTALGRLVGVAPDATWIGCVNLARNLGNAPRYLDCLQFLLAPFPQRGDPLRDGRPELGANVLNNSWGCPEIEGCDPDSLLAAVRGLRAAGVFVVASAGNEGSACGSISAPLSLYDEVFTVGAINENGILAPFSSRGPVTADGSGRTKPDIVAPGVEVLSAMPGGTYGFNDGTSMAGPHVAGVVALLWSANPALVGDIDRTEQILIETAHSDDNQQFDESQCDESAERPNNAIGYGVVDAYAVVERALTEARQ